MTKLKTRTNQPVEDTEGLLNHLSQNGNTTEIDGDLKVNGSTYNNLNDFLDLNTYVMMEEGTPTNKNYESLPVFILKNTDGSHMNYNEFIQIMQQNTKYVCNGYYFMYISWFDEYATVSEKVDNFSGLPTLVLTTYCITQDSNPIDYDAKCTLLFLRDENNHMYYAFAEI